MEYLIYLLIIFAIYAILALGLNLVVGYSGLISVSQGAFFGIGAYSSALLTSRLGWGFFLSLPAGITISLAMAWLMGRIMNRFRDDLFTLVSLGLNTIVFSIFMNWDDITNGAQGITGINRPWIFGSQLSANWQFLILCIVMLACIYYSLHLLIGSSFGRALKSSREDEKMLEVLGFRSEHFKLFAFLAGAMIASLAGALYASFVSFIDPSSFSSTESIFMITIVILGGAASLRGSVLGAFILTMVPECLRFVGFSANAAAQFRQMFYGAFLIILMLYRPQGIWGEYKFK